MSTKDKAPVAPEDNVDVVLDHNYDGIQEYDNPLPKWWTWIFIGTFFFSIGYYAHYHLFGHDGIHDDYTAEMDAFNAAEEKRLLAMGDVSEDNLTELMANTGSVEKGKGVYIANCVPCHGGAGEGTVGPNLTDKHWLHGDGSMMSIYDVVAKGVAAKGMPPWEGNLNAVDLRFVTAYVGTLRNTNVPGKAPQGKEVTNASLKEKK